MKLTQTIENRYIIVKFTDLKTINMKYTALLITLLVIFSCTPEAPTPP